eukprot:2690082-Rhodomonas_salina.3
MTCGSGYRVALSCPVPKPSDITRSRTLFGGLKQGGEEAARTRWEASSRSVERKTSDRTRAATQARRRRGWVLQAWLR